MSRNHIIFNCQGSKVAGTLDAAAGRTGLLIVSGGNELRAGPWSSQAQIARKAAQQGFPVFRFDRRGIGDSEGDNGGFPSSAPDIAAAIAAFRQHAPQLERIVAFGNCDAATALMLMAGHGLDALVLGNPWTFEQHGTLSDDAADPAPMAPSVLRRHYLKRLTDLGALCRLLTCKVKLRQLTGSLVSAARADAGPSALVQQMAAGISGFAGPVSILLAGNDRTAQAFMTSWDRSDPRLQLCPGASHSFAEAEARIWLENQILSALRALA